MITHNTSADDRLKDWRDFRRTLTSDLTKEAQLSKVAHYWTTVPTVRYCLDIDRPESWPSPWEIIHSGEFCPTSIAYLMLKTIGLSSAENLKNSDLKLLHIKDLEIEDYFTVVLVDSTYILNYDHGEVVKWLDIKPNLGFVNELIGFK